MDKTIRTEFIEKKEIVEETDKPKEVAARTPDDLESIPYQLQDQADEESMLSFFRGASSDMLEKWVYEFTQGGKIVQGLTWTGTKEASIWASKLGKKDKMIISEEPQFTKIEEVVIDANKYCDATVVFKDLVTGRMVSGNARQSYLRKSGTKQDYEFVPRMALSKAQRNAIQKLLPTQTLLLFIDFAKKKGKVQTLALAKDQTTLTPEEMKIATSYYSEIEQLNTVEELQQYYKTIKGKTKELPAKIILALTSAMQIKAQNIKNELAKAKVKQMEEKRETGK